MSFYSFTTYSMMFLHMFVGLILIAVILLQRGRGGGLAGALGGMGGQSAFGTKAGDVFTKITIVLATVWIVLGCVCVLLASNFKSYSRMQGLEDSTTIVTPAPDEKPGAGAGATTKPVDEKSPGPDNPPDTKTESNKDATSDSKEAPVAPAVKEIPDKVEPSKTEEPKPEDQKPEEPKSDAADKKPGEAATEKPEEPAKEQDPAPAKEPSETKPE